MPKIKKNQELCQLTIGFNDGTIETFQPQTLPDEQQANLMLLGLSNVLRDTWAGKADTKEGYENCMGRWEALQENRWTQRGETVPRLSVLLRALLAIDPELDKSEIHESLIKMDKAKRKTIESNPKVAEAMAKIKVEDQAERLRKAQEKADEADSVDVMELLA